MSSEPGLQPTQTGPPWSVDVLADLHAGVYPPHVVADLRQRVAGDRTAMEVLAALDSTVDQLSLLPPVRMPERFALRLDAAIAAESRLRSTARRPAGPAQQSRPPWTPAPASYTPQVHPPTERPGTAQAAAPIAATAEPPMSAPGGGPPGPPPGQRVFPHFSAQPPVDNVVPLAAARSRRNRWVGGLAAAAAVAAIGTVTLTSLNNSSPSYVAVPAPSTMTTLSPPSDGVGQPPPGGAKGAPAAPNALELNPGKFQVAYSKINGRQPTGSLADPMRFAACMAANKVAGNDVLGVTEVSYQGRRASAIAVATTDPARARILVVGPSCGLDGASAYLAAESVTR